VSFNDYSLEAIAFFYTEASFYIASLIVTNLKGGNRTPREVESPLLIYTAFKPAINYITELEKTFFFSILLYLVNLITRVETTGHSAITILVLALVPVLALVAVPMLALPMPVLALVVVPVLALLLRLPVLAALLDLLREPVDGRVLNSVVFYSYVPAALAFLGLLALALAFYFFRG
jgi:hypothetical protein